MNRWARARSPQGCLTAVGVAAVVLGLTAAANAPARAGAGANRGRETSRPSPRGKPGPPGFWYGTDSWNSVYTSPCSGKVSKNGIAASVDRADFNGFFDEIADNSNFTPGVYSSAPVWTSIFGTGGFSHIRHTFE